MSAICGVVSTDGRPLDPAELDGMMEALDPLGPDGNGRWAGTVGRCGVAIGAALRHSTPEDEADQQPAQSPDGSLVLVGDLRVDNREDLAGFLGLQDNRSTSDSAFLLAAYERWGRSMLERIIGEFAISIVDRRLGGVLIARDQVGARPLCFHERSGRVAFASTALALTGLEGVGHGLDVRHAAEIIAGAYASSRTFVENVRWVPPGTAVWIEQGHTKRWRWWSPGPVVDLGSAAAHERELRGAFDLAVAARLRSTGAVGASVSGGLDSTSAAATAAALLTPHPLRTYTSAPPPEWTAPEHPGWDADESSLVRALAEVHQNIVPAFVHVPSTVSLLDLQRPLWELGAGPARNPCNMLWIHAIRVRAGADGNTTLFTGDAGNVYFSADGPEWLAALLRGGRLATAWREASALRRASGRSWWAIARQDALPHLLPGGVVRAVRTLRGRPSLRKDWLFTTALRSEIAPELDLSGLIPELNERRDRTARATSEIRALAGQADMSSALAALTGVEARDPTADRRVVEAAARQPEWVRRHDGTTRAVLRGAMADRLPAAILGRTTRGAQLPDWLDLMTAQRAELIAELEQLADHSTSRELMDVARLQQLVRVWPDRTRWADMEVVLEYRLALLRALVISRYLRWFEGRARVGRPAQG